MEGPMYKMMTQNSKEGMKRLPMVFISIFSCPLTVILLTYITLNMEMGFITHEQFTGNLLALSAVAKEGGGTCRSTDECRYHLHLILEQ
jgi:hypothetical protein